MQLLTFDQINGEIGAKKAHLLLGNGFSRACRDDIFSYDSLFERADFASLSREARAAFDALNTTDFEVVMSSMRRASALIRAYRGASDELAVQFTRDSDGLREVLVQAISGSHPAFPAEIESGRYAACKEFLAHFRNIYTLNYDLLLYWANMQNEVAPPLVCDDGFRTPPSGKAGYVTWEIENTDKQNVFYLHGALHLFDAGAELQKYTWVNTGERLIEQIRHALSENKYPLFVAEGSSRSKLERIRHSDYLSRGLRSFAHISGDLVVFGHSFADNDDHVLRLIFRQKTGRLYVGLFGDPESPANKRIVRKAMDFGAQRSTSRPLEVQFYDAATARVWG